MYDTALGIVAPDPSQSCQGLPFDDPCWIAMEPNVVGGGATDGGGSYQAPYPVTVYAQNVPPVSGTPIMLGVTGTPGDTPVTAGTPWGLILAVVGLYALSRSKGGGGRSWGA
jgi:hypothetical protein